MSDELEETNVVRLVPAYHPHWLWAAVKAAPGFVWDRVSGWSPAKIAMFITGASWPMFAALVLLDAWVKLFVLIVAYVIAMSIFMMFALLESERPNGRAAQVDWSNERAGWGP